MDFKYIQTASQLSDDELVELYAQVIVDVIDDYDKDDAIAIDYVLLQDAIISVMLDIRASISRGQFDYNSESFNKICNMLGTLSTIIHSISINLYHNNIEGIKVLEDFSEYLSKDKIYILKGGEEE